MTPNLDDRILTLSEAAQRVRLSVRTVQRLRRRGEFVSAVALSPGRVGFRASDLAAWIGSRPVARSRRG